MVDPCSSLDRNLFARAAAAALMHDVSNDVTIFIFTFSGVHGVHCQNERTFTLAHYLLTMPEVPYALPWTFDDIQLSVCGVYVHVAPTRIGWIWFNWLSLLT